jgi:uncharacterized protein
MQTEADTQRLHELEIRLQGLASFAVAFSGGVDSSFLLAVARKIKPKKLLAVTVSSEFVPSREIEAAKKTASVLKVDHICLSADILGNEDVVRNTEERCYHCKKQIFSLIRSAADDLGIKALLHGVNLDDLKDFRPGLKAADELGFLSPLAEIGFTKKMIRENSRLLGLETWNRPSQSCLATRIPYHVRIQKPDLIRVDLAEAFLQNLGFAQVRVRCHGKKAIIEVEPDLVKMALKEDVRRKIHQTLGEFGFKEVIIDRNGYNSGDRSRKNDQAAVLCGFE